MYSKKSVLGILTCLLIVLFSINVSAQKRYSGKKHSSSHGGRYSNGRGSSHKGGQYKNSKTSNHYGRHKR